MRSCTVWWLLLLLLVPAEAVRAQDAAPEPGLTAVLAAHRARTISDLRYDLSFRIPADADEAIDGALILRFSLSDTSQPLVLDFDADEPHVASVSSDGAPVSFELMNGHVVIPAMALKRGANELEMRFTAGDGSLNRNPDFLYTLFVPDRASNAFPSFDQPDLKAGLPLTLDVPADWQAVANGAQQDVVEMLAADASRSRRPSRSARTSSRLPRGSSRWKRRSATGAPCACSTARRMRRSWRAAATPSSTCTRQRCAGSRTTRAFRTRSASSTSCSYRRSSTAAWSTRARSCTMRPHAAGAESPTQNERLGRASLIAHETAHMWFGDLVTMEWFDDVWMKEVFANFMAAKIVNPAFPDIDHDLRFLVAHHPTAYSVDRTAGTHAIGSSSTT
jgi:aminopeptidase N